MKMREVVREIRKRLGETQQAFAHRMGLAISSIARYEADAVPSAEVLSQMVALATENGWPDIVQVLGAYRNDRLESYARMVAEFGIPSIADIRSDLMQFDHSRAELRKGCSGDLERYVKALEELCIEIRDAINARCDAMDSTIGNSSLNPFILGGRPEIS